MVKSNFEGNEPDAASVGNQNNVIKATHKQVGTAGRSVVVFISGKLRKTHMRNHVVRGSYF